MLQLAEPSTEAWVACALGAIDEILVDHAHCEKKAAGMAVQLLFRYPDRSELLAPLSRLAREELAHFEQVLEVMEAREIAFRSLRPSAYAGKLHAAVRKGEPETLVDTLLVAALIEARSCERFRRLAEAIDDPELARFYRGLLAAEARHRTIYLDLAAAVTTSDLARQRYAELAAIEADAIRSHPPIARVHG